MNPETPETVGWNKRGAPAESILICAVCSTPVLAVSAIEVGETRRVDGGGGASTVSVTGTVTGVNPLALATISAEYVPGPRLTAVTLTVKMLEPKLWVLSQSPPERVRAVKV